MTIQEHLSRVPTALVLSLTLLPGTAWSFQELEQEVGYEYADDETVGIDEKLGETIPLDLVFQNEAGEEVSLEELIDKPTVLTLIYLRCPSICSPLIREVARTADVLDLDPGTDFQLITVSFDVTDNPDLVKTAKTNLLAEMDREMPEGSWRFLTGEAESISALTDAVGFRYRREKGDFVHAGTVIFLSPEGKIVRYLGGLSLLPADMKMALLDASTGTPRSLMQRVQQLCYAYDPEGKTYALKVNRIILLVTLPGIGLFLAYLLLKKKPVAEA